MGFKSEPFGRIKKLSPGLPSCSREQLLTLFESLRGNGCSCLCISALIHKAFELRNRSKPQGVSQHLGSGRQGINPLRLDAQRDSLFLRVVLFEAFLQCLLS